MAPESMSLNPETVEERAAPSSAPSDVQPIPAPREGRGRLALVAVFGVVGAVAGAALLPRVLPGLSEVFARLVNAQQDFQFQPQWYTFLAMGLLGLIAGAALANFALRLFKIWEEQPIGDKVDLFLGVFIGVILSFPFMSVFQALGQVVSPLLTFGLLVGFSALAVYALKSIGDVAPWHRKKDDAAAPAVRSGLKILDTNILIDGRLYDIVKTGFLEGEMYVPVFVLHELQTIADAADPLRRQRGRRGLEVLRHLQSEFTVTVGKHDHHAPDEREPVDARIIRLARAVGGVIVSNDYNLNKVARLQDVPVLNLNDLALSLRINILPGEALGVQLIREGSQYGQAVGYLEDGTMVVVEGGRPWIGETVEAVVSQVIQTERGKMIFAAMDGQEPPTNPPTRRPKR
ncbi:MAG: PIN domain-containing protein [Fimbriimonadaceae bacterium]|nr:PIN domain-containing protein [Fimbriimonadaceae bacterium]